MLMRQYKGAWKRSRLTGVSHDLASAAAVRPPVLGHLAGF